MKIKFCGAAQTVTGSCHLLTLDNGFTILLDCGLYQGHDDEFDEFNSNWLFAPSAIDLLVVSHAHIDHIGRIPKLVKDGFKGNIICTHATRDLAAIMLMDSAGIQERDAQWATEKNLKHKNGKPVEPLYTEEDVRSCLNQFVGLSYNRWTKIYKGVDLLFTDAGHILGSATVSLKIQRENGSETVLGFTGDVGRWNRPIIKDPQAMPALDYLICESTYGGETHEEMPGNIRQFLEIVENTCVKKRGKLIIPAFSLGRTQEIVYMLDQLENSGKLPHIDVYVDSPLAVNATDVFTMHHECFDETLMKYLEYDENPFGFNRLKYIRRVNESKALNEKKEPCIIISASGMVSAGRIRHHVFNNIENPNNTILMVGFCASGTTGALIRERPKTLKLFGKELIVRADIQIVDGLSGHADQGELLKFLSNQDPAKVKKTFLVHGEKERQDQHKYHLEKAGYKNVFIPGLGDEFPLD